MEERGGAAGCLVPAESPVLAEWALGIVPEWDELLISAMELASSLLRARWCALFLLDRDRNRLLLATLWDQIDGRSAGSCELFPGSLEWRVVQESEPAVGARPAEEWFASREAPDGAALCPCACVPVDVEGARFGLVELVRDAGRDPFRAADLQALQLVARHIALWLTNSAVLRRLRELAITDGLTGVYNHRYFQDRLELELQRAIRYERPVSVIMLDLNHFKRYNDVLGHQQGDTALRLTAATIQRIVRRVDVVARYGGDEFAVILPETGALQALVAANRIHQALVGQNLTFPKGSEVGRLSISAGISSYPELAGRKEELVSQADEALYRAKRSRTRPIRLWEPARRRASLPKARVEVGLLG